jgi:hypothetical protein
VVRFVEATGPKITSTVNNIEPADDAVLAFETYEGD